MKIFKNILLVVFLFMGMHLNAQTLVKESFKVWGNCEMCKSTIEKAAESVDGVKSSKWNVSKKTLVVKYNSDKTSIEEIKKKIALSGYDTKEYKATDQVYNNLHHCCQYDRQ